MIGKKKLVLDNSANNKSCRVCLKLLLIGFGVLLLSAGAAVACAYKWYQDGLKAFDEQNNTAVTFIIEKGDGASKIAKKLADAKLIKDSRIFELYARFNKVGGKFQIGNYLLKPSLTLEEIVSDFTTGKTRQMSVTFYPGSTLNFRHNDRDSTPTHREVLQKLGFSDAEIDQAFAKHYVDHPLFKLMPEITNLEGMIFGETFYLGLGSSIDTILKFNFDHYYKVIVDNKLEEKYKEHSLTLYQGIIMASIVEREALSNVDRAQVAQVFLLRHKTGGKLGSDVTYQYISRLRGVPNNMNIDSPYNTRRYIGLPPTPIATPSLSSLLAVAKPAEGDYYYFLAGDDGRTYFAHTYAEHERNIVTHCKVGCSVQ